MIPIDCVEEERERRWEAVAGSSRREKGEGGRGEDENRDGCWSKRGGWAWGGGGGGGGGGGLIGE